MFKLIEPYQKRPIRFLELWEKDGWRNPEESIHPRAYIRRKSDYYLSPIGDAQNEVLVDTECTNLNAVMANAVPRLKANGRTGSEQKP